MTDITRHSFPASNDDTDDRIVCWTRMQAEAGQQLEEIIFRKEFERRANGGTFCWGVGNAPNRCTSYLAKSNARIDVLFSIMKGRPRISDVGPSLTLIWRGYIDCDGLERQLPPGSLVTSKGEFQNRAKSTHFALFCRSDRQLELGDYGSFDPSAFRNVGANGRAVGPSQVTALLRRTSVMGPDGPYRINLKGSLCGSYWVKLIDPIPMNLTKQKQLALFANNKHIATTAEWLDLVGRLREDQATGLQVRERQLALL